ncbi:secreted protein C-like isoform X2 [Macrobrachium rosenbergii]|uniref:secreted protein C-like isoform X2 n=1 Tax=Macrobrachium rosenbergii TaxID=79674 RepID=UPI0034D79D93
MDRLTVLLVLVGFLSPWGSLMVQGQPSGPSLTKIPGSPWSFFPSQGGVPSSNALLVGPGSLSGSSGPDGSFVTGTGNWYAVTGNKPGSSVAFFPSQGGVSSSNTLLVGPGSISTSSGPRGSFVTRTGKWSATTVSKPGISVMFFPSQGGVSSFQSVLVRPGSISGSSGPGRSFVTGTGNWYAVPGSKSGTSVAFFPPRRGVSSSQSVLVGPGSISGSGGPGGSFVTGTGNWYAVPGSKPGMSVSFFPPQGGVLSSQSVLAGQGSISGSSGPRGSFVTGTGNWYGVPGSKPGTSVAFFPLQRGVSSSQSVLVGPGSISGSSGPRGSFITGTGNWSAVTSSKPGTSVSFSPPLGGVSSSQSVLVGPGSISGSSGPGGSFVTGTGNWSATTGSKPGTSVSFFPSQGGVSSSQSVLVGPGSISGSSGSGGSFVTGKCLGKPGSVVFPIPGRSFIKPSGTRLNIWFQWRFSWSTVHPREEFHHPNLFWWDQAQYLVPLVHEEASLLELGTGVP